MNRARETGGSAVQQSDGVARKDGFAVLRGGLVLIGMPGAGKSTLGKRLADHLRLPFVDTDILIEQLAAISLQALLDRLGYERMRHFEEQCVVRCDLPDRAVVSTGGSVVYGPLAMERLKSYGCCVFLAISLATVRARVGNWESRGFSCAPGQTLDEVYHERQPLYRQYADKIIECDGLTEQEVLQRLLAAISAG
jgi:shikimate kinase